MTGRWSPRSRPRLVALGVVAVGVLAFAVTASAGAQTVGGESASVSDATAATDRVAELESLADQTLLQYGGGLGIGLGIGVCLGAFVMYRRQSKRIEETFQ